MLLFLQYTLYHFVLWLRGTQSIKPLCVSWTTRQSIYYFSTQKMSWCNILSLSSHSDWLYVFLRKSWRGDWSSGLLMTNPKRLTVKWDKKSQKQQSIWSIRRWYGDSKARKYTQYLVLCVWACEAVWYWGFPCGKFNVCMPLWAIFEQFSGCCRLLFYCCFESPVILHWL